eukprot:2772010-Amphidinium_carterae.1
MAPTPDPNAYSEQWHPTMHNRTNPMCGFRTMISSGTTTPMLAQSTIHSSISNNHNLCSTLACLELAHQGHRQSTMLTQHSSTRRLSSTLNLPGTY